MSPPKISVVVPCLNEAQHIGQLLKALDQQAFTDFEVLIVDGGSTDGTLEIIQRYLATPHSLTIRLLPNKYQTIPTALNLGIRQAKGEIIARLDGHSQPAPNYLQQCVTVLTESGAAVVGGGWDICSGGPGAIAQAIALAVSTPLGAGDALYRLRSAIEARDTDTVPFGCFDRQTWADVGGYDESLLTNEDYEFNLRVRRRGGRVRFDPTLRCIYYARPTLRSLCQQYGRYGWWKGKMLRHHPGSIRWRQALPLLFVGGSVLLLMAGAVWPLFNGVLVALWGVYFVGVSGYSVWLAQRRQAQPIFLALALMIIHLAWGAAAWAGLLLPIQIFR